MTSLSLKPRRQFVARILASSGQSSTVASPSLVLTVGLPGSGKSTFCRLLAAETGATVLESDRLRRLLFGEPSFRFSESRSLFAALNEAARHLLLDGASVIIDATNLREADREPAYAIAAETGARLLLLHFNTREAVVAARLQQRKQAPQPDDNSTADWSVYRRLAMTAEPLIRQAWRIDTSDQRATRAMLRQIVKEMSQRPPAEVRVLLRGGQIQREEAVL